MSAKLIYKKCTICDAMAFPLKLTLLGSNVNEKPLLGAHNYLSKGMTSPTKTEAWTESMFSPAWLH